MLVFHHMLLIIGTIPNMQQIVAVVLGIFAASILLLLMLFLGVDQDLIVLPVFVIGDVFAVIFIIKEKLIGCLMADFVLMVVVCLLICPLDFKLDIVFVHHVRVFVQHVHDLWQMALIRLIIIDLPFSLHLSVVNGRESHGWSELF